jgi:D-3-phosphoglycerate dehydrogenase
LSFAVTCLGGPIAPEGVAIIEKAGGRITVTGAYPSHEDALSALRDADAIIVRLIEFVDEEMMRASGRLKVIAKHGVGTNDIDVSAARRLSIPVAIAAATNAQSVAEHALGLMLALAKDFSAQDRNVRSGIWDKTLYKGRELRGQTLGMIGFGQIGRLFAKMAAAIGMRVIAYDPQAPDGAFTDVARSRDLTELLAVSDVVSLHCPLTPETRGLVAAPQFSAMKRGAFLINTARGEIVDEAALIAALDSGALAGAGLDSFAAEPPGADNPLWRHGNIIVTPHVAGVTVDARRATSVMTAQTVIDAVTTGRVRPDLLVS